MFKIGEFSKLSHVSVRMLRHYEEVGLLLPQYIDMDTGYRYYLASQISITGKILKLREIGFSLAIIKEILEQEDVNQIQEYFRLRQEEIKDELSTIQRQAALLEVASNIVKEDINYMNYNVVLKTIPARKVISYRAIIPNYQSEGMLWEVMFREVTKQNVKFAADPLSMAIFHDKEYKESDVDVEVQNAVVGDYASTEEVKFYESGAIEVASVTFHGGFEQMPAVSQAAAEWIDKNAYVLAGPMLNIYHVGPAQDNNPENWVTEACYTIKKV